MLTKTVSLRPTPARVRIATAKVIPLDRHMSFSPWLLKPLENDTMARPCAKSSQYITWMTEDPTLRWSYITLMMRRTTHLP